MLAKNKILKSILLSVISCGALGSSVFADVEMPFGPYGLQNLNGDYSVAITILGWLAVEAIVLSICIIVAMKMMKKSNGNNKVKNKEEKDD